MTVIIELSVPATDRPENPVVQVAAAIHSRHFTPSAGSGPATCRAPWQPQPGRFGGEVAFPLVLCRIWLSTRMLGNRVIDDQNARLCVPEGAGWSGS